jgi:superfamily I DNA/RNA helicase
MSRKMIWSDQQIAIFDWFKTAEKRNLVVRARAGTGKSTSIIEGIRHAPEDQVLVTSFSKLSVTDLENKIRDTGSRGQAKTLHGVGFACIRRYWDRVSVARPVSDRADQLTEQVVGQVPITIKRLVSKLHTKGREMAPFARELGDLTALAYEFDCAPDEEWAEDGYGLDFVESAALRAMELAATQQTTAIDFADMLYLPVRNRWMRKEWDLVVVDEAQDMSATQLLLALGVARGRIVLVGDDRQAIYGFRGADSGSLDRLKGELQADELGLNCTYRCGTAIVDLARALVPDYIAHESNGTGLVRSAPASTLVNSVEMGDFLLSRKNAPLVTAALKILRAGKRCKIQGRDIGQGLIALVRNLAKGKARDSMPAFLAKLTTWEEREIRRAWKGSRSDAIAASREEQIKERAETLVALADGMSSVRELIARIEDLFSDDDRQPHVTASSIHRAKGLEADRVFVLRDTLYPRMPCQCGHWHNGKGCNRCSCATYRVPDSRMQEEENLEYVAITRARHELVWLNGDL